MLYFLCRKHRSIWYWLTSSDVYAPSAQEGLSMQTAGDVLVIDDEQSIVDLITEVLEDEGYSVRASLTVADARALIVEHRPDLVLLDLHMPDETGYTLVPDLNTAGLANISIILMTADAQAVQEISMEGIDFYLPKPFYLDELIDCVAKHIRRSCTV
jgi:DNA-binding response OmpR family regulator